MPRFDLYKGVPARLILAFALLLASAPLLRAQEKPVELADFEESWQAVYISGARVGYGRSSTGSKMKDGQKVIVTDTEMVMALKRFGQLIKTKTVIQTEETADGNLLEFRYDMQAPPAANTRSVGRVTGDKLALESEVAGKVRKSELPWDKSIKAPGYQDRVLRDNPLKPGDTRTLKTFDPQFGKVNTVTLKAEGFENVKMLDGKEQKLLKVLASQSVAPGITMLEFLDNRGEALKTSFSLLGMETYQVAKADALKALTGEEVDVAVTTLVKTPNIEKSFDTKKVVYRVTIQGDDPAKFLPSGPTQSLKSLGPHSAELTVTALTPPAKSASTEKPSEKYTAPNSYIQSDDDLVKKHATAAAGKETDPWKASVALEKWVHGNLKEKNFSTLLASAAEVAKDLSGDCTEHAVLLAAMARVRGIPSRVAVGLVYAPSLAAFGGHMWTEVYVNGVWVPLDATLGRGGIAADHIKFADSSFSDDDEIAPLSSFIPLVSILGKMQIDVIKVEH